ncbi:MULTISPECIES: NAD-dependent epimerase/dehydratase family protein [unclassified Streptomyces]|uniref:NAD-dependent epimerase/dehydratase family protein n=1 Tax=unclassified Streptomyces TaxID=2593676 RepID=UPI0036391DBE
MNEATTAPRIAVIGAGFLGSALASGAARRGLAVTVIGRSDPYGLGDSASPADVVFVPGCGAERLPEVLRSGVDVVVIAAGGHFPVPSGSEPAADVIGTLSLVIPVCELVRAESPGTAVVLLSSAGAVYALGTEPKRESETAEPTSPYGMSRMVAEQYLAYYGRVHGLRTCALRCSNIYGRLLPRTRGQNVVSAAFWSALTSTPFTLHGGGRQIRDFLHVDDFVGATLDLLAGHQRLPRVVNVGTGVGHSVSDLISAVETATDSVVPTVPGAAAITDRGRLVVDTALLRSLIGFEPLGLAAGVALMARDVGKR